MAVRANPFFDLASPADAAQVSSEPRASVARLAQMHAEAVETARLANLLGRAWHAAVALPVLAVLTVVLSGAAGTPPLVAWGILIAVASLAVVRVYGAAIRQPFERASLHAFAQDLSACLLYAGFAWGAGAFLVLGGSASGGTALLFASVPAVVLAVLLRERNATLLFLAPVAALTAFACVLRPFSGGALAAALVLIACAVVAAAIVAAARYSARRHETDMPQGLLAS
jgi:hypothetical protein